MALARRGPAATRFRTRLRCTLGVVVLGLVTGCSHTVVIPATDCPYDFVDYSAVTELEPRVKIATALEECGLRTVGAQQMTMLDEAARARVLRCLFTSSSSRVEEPQAKLVSTPTPSGGFAPTMQVSTNSRITEVWAEVALVDVRGRSIYAARGSVEPVRATNTRVNPADVLLALTAHWKN